VSVVLVGELSTRPSLKDFLTRKFSRGQLGPVFFEEASMKLFLSLAIATVFATNLSAQQAEVKVDHHAVSTVEVWHPSFMTMCRSLAQKLGAENEEVIRLQPKSLPPSRERYLGDIWTAEAKGKTIEVSASELPQVLQRLRGSIVREIFRGSCGLRDSYFYSTEHVVFVAVGRQEAEALAATLR